MMSFVVLLLFLIFLLLLMLFCRCRGRRPYYCLCFSVLHFFRPVVVLVVNFVVLLAKVVLSCLLLTSLLLVSYGSERAAGVSNPDPSPFFRRGGHGKG